MRRNRRVLAGAGAAVTLGATADLTSSTNDAISGEIRRQGYSAKAATVPGPSSLGAYPVWSLPRFGAVTGPRDLTQIVGDGGGGTTVATHP